MAVISYQSKNKATQTQSTVQRTGPGKDSLCLEDNRSSAIVRCSTAAFPSQVLQRAGSLGTHANIGVAGSYNDPSAAIPAGNKAPHVIRTTFQTDLKDGYGASKKVTEGETMVAFPLSGHNCAGGSGTTDYVRPVSQEATKLYKKKYIAGHLLNDHLGGPGDKRDNITAITAKSNSQHHVGIEKELKDDVLNKGFIAFYTVDCSLRAGELPAAPGFGVPSIDGLAKQMIAKYSLLRIGGDPTNQGDYLPVRVLDLALDPGGTGQIALKDGRALVLDSEVVQDRMEAKFVSKPQSDLEFAALLSQVQTMGIPAAIAHIKANAAASITDPTDAKRVQDKIEEYIRD